MLLILLLGAAAGYGVYRLATADEAAPAPPPQPVPPPAAKLPAKVGVQLDAIQRDLEAMRSQAARAVRESQAYRRGLQQGAKAAVERLVPKRIPRVAPVIIEDDLADAFARDEHMGGGEHDDIDPTIVELQEDE